MGSLVSKALGKEVGRMSPGARRAASAQEVEGTNELGSAWLKKANETKASRMNPKAAAADAKQAAWEQQMLKEFRERKEAEQKIRGDSQAAERERIAAIEGKSAAEEKQVDLARSIAGPDYGTPELNPMADFEMDKSLLQEAKLAPELIKTARPDDDLTGFEETAAYRRVLAKEGRSSMANPGMSAKEQEVVGEQLTRKDLIELYHLYSSGVEWSPERLGERFELSPETVKNLIQHVTFPRLVNQGTKGMDMEELPFGVWPREDQRGVAQAERAETERLQFAPDRGSIAREAAADMMRASPGSRE